MFPVHSDISYNWDLRALHVYVACFQSCHTKAQCLAEIFYSKFFCDSACSYSFSNAWIILNLSFLCLFKYPRRTRNIYIFIYFNFFFFLNKDFDHMKIYFLVIIPQFYVQKKFLSIISLFHYLRSICQGQQQIRHNSFKWQAAFLHSYYLFTEFSAALVVKVK